MKFILEYLKQPSTLRGIISILVGLGLFHLSPEVQDSIVQTIVLLIAAGTGVNGTINIIRNENKKKVEDVTDKKIHEPKPSTDTVNQLQSGKF